MKKELENCPHCGSSDVGGSNNMAYCYNCGHEVRALTNSKAFEKWNAEAKCFLEKEKQLHQSGAYQNQYKPSEK